MADVRFLKSEVVITNNTAVDWTILSKFGVEIHLDIAKRVLSPNPKPGVDFQLYSRNFEKLKKIDMMSQPCREWSRLDEIW